MAPMGSGVKPGKVPGTDTAGNRLVNTSASTDR